MTPNLLLYMAGRRLSQPQVEIGKKVGRAGTKRKVVIPRWPIWLEGLGDVQVKAPSRPVQGPV